MTLLTPEEAAAFLRVTKEQLYNMTRKRGVMRMRKPIPTIRMNGSLRFVKESLIQWLQTLEETA